MHTTKWRLMMTFTMSVWLLVGPSYFYAFGEFSRRRNRQTRPLRFSVHDALRRRDDLGEYARLVYKNFRWTFQRILSDVNIAVYLRSGAGGTIYFTSANCVRAWLYKCRDVRRRTVVRCRTMQCERRLRPANIRGPADV